MKQPLQGVGLGLRIPHLHEVLASKPNVPWFEVHICNFLRGGLNRALLDRIARDYPLSFHGVSLNLGGADELDDDYLQRLKRLVNELEPALVSEHACFTAHNGNNFHDLLPPPFTRQAVSHFVDRIDYVQNLLGRTLVIENISRYCEYSISDMSEGQFLSEICRQSGCELIFDINNAYVNQLNLGVGWRALLEELPLRQISEVHLAGHSLQGELFVDTHSAPVCAEVWLCYREFVERVPNVPCLIEWDNDLPEFSRLLAERDRAQAILEAAGKNSWQESGLCANHDR